MVRVSIYRLPEVSDLEAVVKLVRQNLRAGRTVANNDWPSEDLLQIGFSRVEPGIPMTQRVHRYGNTEFRYVLALGRVEQPKVPRWWFQEGQLRAFEDRTNVAEAPIMFFQHEHGIHAAIFSLKQQHLAMLARELMPIEKWGPLDPADDYHVDPDFFYWILRTRMEKRGRLSPAIRVVEVSGFEGHTPQEIHTMKGKGDGIYELLSTMGVLVNANPIRALTMEIEYNGETLMFFYNAVGGAVLNELHYRGKWVGQATGEGRKVLIVAYLYSVLMPAILAEYTWEDKDWTPGVRFAFLQRVGKKMIRKIAKELKWDDSRPLRDLLK